MINREISGKFNEYDQYYQIISLTGPRQSGKSTFIQHAVKKLPYINLESPDERRFAISDPKHFLQRFPKGAVLDEVQYVPELFSYIQAMTDADKSLKFYLTGSQNFLMQERISQSLAGRVGLLTLLPFSFSELKKAKRAIENLQVQQFTGFYPRIFDRDIPPREFYRNYVNTYLQRDVQGLIRNENMESFNRFIALVSGRAGQILNYQSLANDTGLSVPSIQTWIRILERSYIIFLLPPYHKNFRKRIVKSPKLYFFDTGLLCYLLNIEKPEQLATHYAKGAIFENYVISEMFKLRVHRGLSPNLFYWKDSNNKEVDCLLDTGEGQAAYEIKSSTTFSPSFFENIQYWEKISGNKNSSVIYGGDKSFSSASGQVVAWNKIKI
jgi:predicted AAA+ superfamily ATPase